MVPPFLRGRPHHPDRFPSRQACLGTPDYRDGKRNPRSKNNLKTCGFMLCFVK